MGILNQTSIGLFPKYKNANSEGQYNMQQHTFSFCCPFYIAKKKGISEIICEN